MAKKSSARTRRHRTHTLTEADVRLMTDELIVSRFKGNLDSLISGLSQIVSMR